MPQGALRSLLPIAGWGQDRVDEVRFSNDADPIIQSPFRLGVAAAATLAATGLAAADLWQARTGRRQTVQIDVRQAAASLRSGRYLRINDARVDSDRNPLMGFYPSRDGRWLYVHANFPNHRAAALNLLRCEETTESVTRAAARWNAADWEEAIVAANGAGGMVRDYNEWSAHAQAAAIAALPVMEIVRIGDAPPEPLPVGARPLSGIRVVDITRVIAGPSCARTLAEHGADVMKISAAHLPNLAHQELDTGHGKLSTYLDMRDPAQLETLKGLIQDADIFSQGYRPGTLDGRGLSPEALAAQRPGIIYISLSAFGHTGPWAMRRGFDTVIQTVSGMADRQGALVPGAVPGPQFYPAAAIDYCTGYLMAAGTMIALKRRAEQGGSWLVRISLAQVGKWMVDLGEVSPTSLMGLPADLRAEEIDRWSMETETPSGRLRHLKPVVQLSETPSYWARPTVPLGYHPPVWPGA